MLISNLIVGLLILGTMAVSFLIWFFLPSQGEYDRLTNYKAQCIVNRSSKITGRRRLANKSSKIIGRRPSAITNWVRPLHNFRTSINWVIPRKYDRRKYPTRDY